jgi:hypothetical protein
MGGAVAYFLASSIVVRRPMMGEGDNGAPHPAPARAASGGSSFCGSVARVVTLRVNAERHEGERR